MFDGAPYVRYAEMREGLNNKFYEVSIDRSGEQVKWVFRWGRIGSTGQSKTGPAYSEREAKRHCDDQFQSKLDKGYREVSAMEVIASAALDVADRPVRGLNPVAVAIPDFGAGPSEERCQAFAKKYIDKMNVVRKSKDDMDNKKYHEQIWSVVDSYADEWKRMKSSDTHRLNLGAQADAAYEVVYQALYTYGVRTKPEA